MLDPKIAAEWLCNARERCIALTRELDGPQWLGPQLTIVNPPLWELGHVAWFTEFWVLRHAAGEPPLRADADRQYDSSAVEHGERWRLPLPDRDATFGYLDAVHERVLALLEQRQLDDRLAFFVQLALFHQDMHNEAFAYTWQTLGYPAPEALRGSPDTPVDETLVDGDVAFDGGSFELGARADDGFAFDNELGRHVVEHDPFRLARRQVTQSEFAAFVDDRGYERRELWCDAGWSWRERADAHHPVYWRRAGRDLWQRRVFDQWRSLEPDLPVVHVNWFEARAYCRWAGRRLPTEVEWEVSAVGAGVGRERRRYPWGDDPADTARCNTDFRHGGCVPVTAFAFGDTPDGCRQLVGNTWEWTASEFLPYPGFEPGPYRDYSAPWFGSRMVLRGGAWTSALRMLHNTLRNFYEPHRRDVLAGFRTCAVQGD